MQRSAARIILFALIILIATQGHAAGSLDHARPVSPGSATGFARIEGRCPTFSWTAVEKAMGYEIVVYRLEARESGSADPAASAGQLHGARPAFRLELEGQATSWTPSGARCLEPAQSYAWAVRGLPRDRLEPQWSEPYLFTVGVLPTAEEVRKAMDVLERFLAGSGEVATASSFSIGGFAGSPMPGLASLGPIPSIASTAISAELSDTGIATAGLAARSHSASGIAGVLQNTANGKIASFQNFSNEVASVAGDGTVSAMKFVGDFVGDGSGLTNLPGDAGAQTVSVFASTESIAAEGTILSRTIEAPEGGCRLVAAATVDLKFDDLGDPPSNPGTQTTYDDPYCELRVGGTALAGSRMTVGVDPFHRYDVCVSAAGKDLSAGMHTLGFFLELETTPIPPDSGEDQPQPATADSATLTAVCIPTGSS